MITFLKSLWPSNPPPHVVGKKQIVILREKILQTILLSILALFTPVYGLLINIALRNNALNDITFLTGVFIVLLALTLIRKLAYVPRALSLVIILFLVGSISLILFGNSGSGFLLLLIFVALTITLLGPSPGLVATVLSLLTALLISIGMENGRFILAPNPNTGLGWARSGSIFLLTVGVISSSITIITLGLQRSLQQSLQLSNDLQDQKDTLSQSVQEKTKNLERRITQIRVTTEIVRSFSSVLHTEELLQKVVDLICDRLDLYYVGLFLVDSDHQYAVLKAGTGEAGRSMLTNQHRLLIGGVSMIGWSIANLKPRIALDIGKEKIHFNNSNLPETRSELALPIMSHSLALGALSIQSTLENAFDDDDITILQGIADSLGIALENARFFEQNQKDLIEISSLNRQYVQQSWSDEITATGALAFIYENPGVQATDSSGQKLQIPIRLRDQVIGQLEIEKDTQEYSDDEIELVESISSQTAVALESARLLQESQRKASQEEKIVELTSKFSQAFNIDDILQTAVKELGQLPSISEVSIQLSGQNQNNTQNHQDPNNHQEGAE